MATTTSKSKTFIPDLEAATERALEANERLAKASRTITGAYLDGLEKYVDGLADFERKLAAQSKVEVVTDLFNAHAQVSQDLTKAGVRVAREFIAA
jgi:hypothetical protein